MKDLINQYRFEADRISQHLVVLKKELAAVPYIELATQENIELVNRLKARIRLLEEERYEIIRDINDMEKGQSFRIPHVY